MSRKIIICLLILTVALPFSGTVLYGDDEHPPENFNYTFKAVAPVKIFSGPVHFGHKRHVTQYRLTCEKCHHTLAPGETEVDESCMDCHAEEGFIRGEQAAGLDEEELMSHYLNALHKQCIDCHIEIKLNDTKATPPISCTRCHIRSASGVKSPQ